MPERVGKADLVERAAQQTGRDTTAVTAVVDATFAEIAAALADDAPVTIRALDTFYVRVERDRSVFRFNPSQRLRAAFGWSSSYRGER
jgi:DNA-binding protein HU-beta